MRVCASWDYNGGQIILRADRSEKTHILDTERVVLKDVSMSDENHISGGLISMSELQSKLEQSGSIVQVPTVHLVIDPDTKQYGKSRKFYWTYKGQRIKLEHSNISTALLSFYEDHHSLQANISFADGLHINIFESIEECNQALLASIGTDKYKLPTKGVDTDIICVTYNTSTKNFQVQQYKYMEGESGIVSLDGEVALLKIRDVYDLYFKARYDRGVTEVRYFVKLKDR